jgi:GPH family glycoside/pentoside/hexuronide:cation symporter
MITNEKPIYKETNDSMLQKIGLREKVGYGFGDFASNLLFFATASFLTFFYTDTVGLAAGAVGTLMLIARVLDALIDIGIGALVDRTNSKHGKARPWLLWMALPFAVSGVLLFTVPSAGPAVTLVYVYITYLLMNFIYSAINVPYGVLNSLVTQDPYQRSVLNIFRMVLALFGALFVTFFTMPLVSALGDGKLGWILTFSIFGILALVMFLFTFATTKERVKPSVVQKKVPFKKGINALFRNKYWGLMVGFAVIFFANYTMSSGIIVYYSEYILNNQSLVGILGMCTLLPQLLGFSVLAFIIKRYGKRNTAMAGSFIIIAGSLVIAINPESLTIVVSGLIIKALGSSAIMGTIFAMLADTIEYGEWKTGIRTEGLVYSAGSFGTKAGSGIGSAVVGWGLAMGGYIGGQTTVSASALFSIQFMFIYLPIIFSVIQILILWFHRMDRIYPDIIKELQWVRSR